MALKSIKEEALDKNGGDSDTVDGKHADDFLSVSGGKIYGDEEEINLSPWGVEGNGNSIIRDFYIISASSFEENGSLLDNKYLQIKNMPEHLPADGGNADTLDNKHANDFYQCDRTAFKSGVTILEWANAQSTNTSKGIVMSNYPEDAPIEQEGTAEVIVFDGNRKIVRFTSYSTKTTYVRSIFRSEWLTAWKKTEDGGNASTLGGKTISEIQNYNNLTNKPSSLPANGGNAESVNKKIKNFTVQTGSWFRLAKNDKNSCGGVFVLTIGSGSSYSSTTVFSAAQQYSSLSDSTLKLKCLSHSHFNNCVTKLRVVNQAGGSYEQYIDFYVANGDNGRTGDVEVQFFGKSWVIYDSITSANIASGYTATEISLQ